ncbi:PilW family protein [Vibrio crassostreae]|uniref:PilW family protein n=1 Tax=Vibrio crassostreae TaxID=246167 RepID=UPI000F4AD7B8|nr:prepilin-type N-terminal cleavage/methylation domain-containing protein [Vibrio crassostreae]ROP14531.1 MSHA biogenesis protein MshO [Vibrio crassostreae]ROP15831.1 MSHA biogenesis protein MshO [Vibrio crassostreae]RPE90253.1 MSHA biogenesis protein MshO [Vibrio crassostreae]TCN72505.1 MSHA biogenesis protein MshO [Vibrio crassostreae]TCV20118.1 MSHA biogenesis protein MshO [Vibrio crassostreae]
MRIKGFTLIELILAIVVSSILLLGLANFTEVGVKGYFGTVERYRLQTEANFVIEKISREMRHAVPNLFPSAASSGCVSFYPIVDSGFYVVSGADVNFLVSDSDSDVQSLQNLSMVINPTRSYEEITNIDNVFPLTNISQATGAGVSGAAFTLAGQASELVGGSVSNRHYIFDDDNPVEYCLSGDKFLTRANGGAPVIISDKLDVAQSSLQYLPATVQQNGIVDLTLTFTVNGETTTFEQEVQVLNVP